MPRQNSIQSSFSKGEVSPLARGRVDVSLYGSGAETVENLIVRQQGALFRRSGTKCVRKSKLVTSAVRTIPFTVSDETAYELEFGVNYIHFYKNKEPLFETTTTEVEEYSIANLGGLAQIESGSGDDSDIPGWGDLSLLPGAPTDNGTVLQTAGSGTTVRMTTSVPNTLRTGVTVKVHSGTNTNNVNGLSFVITRISAYAFDLVGSTYVGNVGASGTIVVTHGLLPGDRVFFSGGAENPVLAEKFHTVAAVQSYRLFTVANVAFTSIADTTPSLEEVHTIPIEVVTTYSAADLPDITYAQSADVLYLFHPNHPTRKLVRLDTDGDRNDWLLADVPFTDGPYLPFNDLSPNVNTTTPGDGAVYRDIHFEVSAYTHTATVTSATAFAAGTPSTDQGLYLEYRSGDQWRLAQLTTAAGAATTGTVSIIDNVLLAIDESTRLQSAAKQKAVTGSIGGSPIVGTRPGPNGTTVAVARNGLTQRIDPNNSLVGIIAGGTLTAQFSNTFGSQDIGKYIRFNTSSAPPLAAWAQITGTVGAVGSTVTTAAAVAMVSNNHTGLFILSNETRSATVKAFRSGTAFSAFVSTDVGRLMRLGFSGRWTWGIISAFTSASQVTVTLYEDMPRDLQDARNVAGHNYGFNSADNTLTTTSPTTGITYDWRMGSWSVTTGYPRCGGFHEQRLILAGTLTQPASFWGSVSGDFENMAPSEIDSTVLDDSAIAYTLGSTKANSIKWILSGPALTIGTSGGEWQVRASTSISDPITPANVKAIEYTAHGSGSVRTPARVGTSLVFVDRSAEKVHELFYSFEKDAVDSDDLTAISEHIMRVHGGAVASAYQTKPHSIFWVLCADGTLSAMTFNKKQEVIGWHHHTIAGGTVEDISVIPGATGGDELWMVVARTISATTVRYIEVLEDDFYPSSSSSLLGMRFLDGHTVIEGFTGTVITGLNNLEGLAVVVVKDGTRLAGTSTVTSGAITLSAGAVSELVIGLNGNADVKSLPPEGGSQFGTSQGQTKRVVAVDGRYYNMIASAGIYEGPSFTELTNGSFPTVSPALFFTGTNRILGAHGYDNEAPWCLRQSEPYPFNLLFVVSKLETNE